MMKKRFFKQHQECGDNEWTIYGCYGNEDIESQGDVLCEVDMVDTGPNKEHIIHSIYRDYIEPDEVTYITEEEYQMVINRLREAESYLDKADEVLRKLI